MDDREWKLSFCQIFTITFVSFILKLDFSKKLINTEKQVYIYIYTYMYKYTQWTMLKIESDFFRIINGDNGIINIKKNKKAAWSNYNRINQQQSSHYTKLTTGWQTDITYLLR